MRRFSQRNSLVTLSDINITPLLDLAFVLLIIFVITTPLLEQGLDLRLPEGGKPDKSFSKGDIRTVEIDPGGGYALDKVRLSLDQLELRLAEAFRANKDTVVFIRADREALVKYLYPVVDRCQRRGITRFSLRTEPLRTTK
jgi:biopolymer transport protein ExbD